MFFLPLGGLNVALVAAVPLGIDLHRDKTEICRHFHRMEHSGMLRGRSVLAVTKDREQGKGLKIEGLGFTPRLAMKQVVDLGAIGSHAAIHLPVDERKHASGQLQIDKAVKPPKSLAARYSHDNSDGGWKTV